MTTGCLSDQMLRSGSGRIILSLAVWWFSASAVGAVQPSDFTIRSWQTGDGLPQNGVNAILQTRDSYLWVGTDNGLARFDGERFKQPHRDDGLAGVEVRSLAEDGEGALWIGTEGSGLFRMHAGRVTRFGRADGVGDVYHAKAEGEGRLWLEGGGVLSHWTGTNFLRDFSTEGLPRGTVRALHVDDAGSRGGTLAALNLPGNRHVKK